MSITSIDRCSTGSFDRAVHIFLEEVTILMEFLLVGQVTWETGPRTTFLFTQMGWTWGTQDQQLAAEQGRGPLMTFIRAGS